MELSALVIGLDVGTTTCKAVAVSADGRVEASAMAEYPLHAPKPGWAEQDVNEIWKGACASLRELLAKVDAKRVEGLALSGAMHCVLPVDRDGRALSPAMTWADNRAMEDARELRASPSTLSFYSRTGCPVQWLYLPAKLRWLKRNRPDLFATGAAGGRFVAIKDFLLHRLTGVWATDICIASGSGLLDLHSRTWHGEALDAAGITAGQLPMLVEPHAIVGHITGDAARSTGLPAGLPVMPGGGDGGLANIGAGAATPGAVVITVGTSGAVRVTTDKPLLDARQRTWCYVLNQQHWYAGGAINNGGLAVETIRHLHYSDLPKERGFDHLFADADSIAPASHIPLMLPYFAGERSPHWRPDLKASVHGLTHSHERAHLARAVLEGVAFCLADVWEAVREGGLGFGVLGLGEEAEEDHDAKSDRNSADQAGVAASSIRTPHPTPHTPHPVLLTGGITRSRVWSQIVCDVLSVPLALCDVGDASALGAAAIARLGLGHIASLAQVNANAQSEVTLTPREEYRSLYQERHRAFQQRAKEMMERLA